MQANIFMSHEGLQLAYEEALTRPVRVEPPATPLTRASSAAAVESPLRPRVRSGGLPHSPAPAASSKSAVAVPALSLAQAARTVHYNLGTHFIWIGACRPAGTSEAWGPLLGASCVLLFVQAIAHGNSTMHT